MSVSATNSIPFPNPITENFIADDAVTSDKIKDGEIKNADVSSTAAIAHTKIAGASYLIYGGADLSGTSVIQSTTETTLLSFTIPAGTFPTGSICIVSFRGECTAGNQYATVRLKIGASGSETEKIAVTHGSVGEKTVGSFSWYDEAETYTNELSVLVTGQNTQDAADALIEGVTLIVLGR